MITRRELMRIFLISLGALITFAPVKAWAKKLAFKLDKAEALKNVNGWTILELKEKQVMFIRDTDTTVKAFSPICTHQKCVVAYNPDHKRIECPCHGSIYDLDGKVLSGPAPAPLQTYPAEIKDDKIIVDLPE